MPAEDAEPPPRREARVQRCGDCVGGRLRTASARVHPRGRPVNRAPTGTADRDTRTMQTISPQSETVDDSRPTARTRPFGTWLSLINGGE